MALDVDPTPFIQYTKRLINDNTIDGNTFFGPRASSGEGVRFDLDGTTFTFKINSVSNNLRFMGTGPYLGITYMIVIGPPTWLVRKTVTFTLLSPSNNPESNKACALQCLADLEAGQQMVTRIVM